MFSAASDFNQRVHQDSCGGRRLIGIWRPEGEETYMKRLLCLLSLALSILAGQETVLAQSTRPDTVVGPLKDGWESIDQRLVFLTIRLSSVELSIDAVNKALVLAGWQKNVKLSEAQKAQQANDAMDQNGGGPVPWQQFYGNTAEKFFYHPTDDRTRHVNPVPIDQRPPQLDYIYHANSNAEERAQAEAANLGNKIDALLSRRHQLEEQQSALWCRMSFRALATRNISLKPLFRFDVTKADSDPTDLQRVEATRAGAKFVRMVEQLMTQAQAAVATNQGAVVDKLQKAIDDAHTALIEKMEGQQLIANDLSDSSTAIGKFAAAAQHLDDSAGNLAEAYHLIQDGDKAGDDQETKTFRGQLQQSYFDLASSLYTAQQCLTTAASEWKVVPDHTQPAPAVFVDLGVVPDTKQDMGQDFQSTLKEFRVEACIDGLTELHLTADGLWWKELGAAKPGRMNGVNLPTYIDGKPWYPEWHKASEIRGYDSCEPFKMPLGTLNFDYEVEAIGGDDSTTNPHEISGIEDRDPVTMISEPNQQVISIPDSQPGEKWYRLRIFRVGQ
jgi:hypothetical protein